MICNRIGGHLPEFNSRKDLEELVSFLKKRPNLPVLEAIYIGLKLDPDTSVSIETNKALRDFHTNTSAVLHILFHVSDIQVDNKKPCNIPSMGKQIL